jgi:hypothetical protein
MSVCAKPEELEVLSPDEMPAEIPNAPPDLAGVRSILVFSSSVVHTYAEA